MNELNMKNAEYFGAEKQMVVLVEELAELTQAATKWLRIAQNGQTVRKSADEVMANLIEELADVSVMTDQIKHLLGISEKQLHDIRSEKIKRTAENIAKEQENGFRKHIADRRLK